MECISLRAQALLVFALCQPVHSCIEPCIPTWARFLFRNLLRLVYIHFHLLLAISACEKNTVLPTASFITQDVVTAEAAKKISLFCVFHGDIMDVNFQICWNTTIPAILHICSSMNPGTNYYFNRINLNCTSVGEINVPAGDYKYSCNAVSTNKSAHHPPGNTLDSKICKFI